MPAAPAHPLPFHPGPVDPGARSHCPFCAFQCGMTLAPVGDGLVVRGDPSFPVNRGQMCIKGFSAGELLRHPDRLLSPLRRSPDGSFEPVAWDVALGDIASRIRAIQTAHGRDAVACFGSGSLTNEKAYLLGKFARVALRTSSLDYNGRYCMSSAAAAQNKAFGLDRGMPFPLSDVERARTVLLWGANVADTLPPIMQYFERQSRNGGRLVVADPRLTATARAAHLHLQLTPGSDLILANGLLHLAIEERLVDAGYVASRTTGFDAVRAAVSRYAPEIVERVTGVPVEQMRTAVRWLAEDSAILLSGRGPEQQSKGVDGVLALTNLMLALGKVGLPFSGFGTLTGQGNGQGGREHGQKADQLPGYRLIEDERHRREIAAIWNVDPAELPGKGPSAVELLADMGRGVRGLLVFGSNVAVATPDADAVARGLAALDLLVVADVFMNETARHAHYVLPVTQWAEEEGTLTNLEGRLLHRRPMVAPPGDVRNDLFILTELAAQLGRREHFSFAAPREVFEELRRATAGAPADYSGVTYERIDRLQKAGEGLHWPVVGEDHPGTPRLFRNRFAHRDGRARFVPVEHRPAGEMPGAEYPFFLTTGRLKEQYNSGAQTRRISPLRDARPRPLVQIHPRAADRLGLADGLPALVQTRRGSAEFAVQVTADVRPDTLFVPFHYGGADAVNRLTNPALDPASRMPEFKVCAARITPPITKER